MWPLLPDDPRFGALAAPPGAAKAPTILGNATGTIAFRKPLPSMLVEIQPSLAARVGDIEMDRAS